MPGSGTLHAMLPRGGGLPAEEWVRRHRALVAVLWLNVLILPAYGVAAGHYGALHDLAHAAALVTFAILSSTPRLGRKARSLSTSLGLLTAAALLVHLTGGLIEAHFYFFVVIVVLTLYGDWSVFLLAVAYVLIHHGLIGTLEPHQVFNRPDAWTHPWKWAGIHAFFVALAGIGGVVAWRLNEDVRERMRAVQEKLETLSASDSLTGLPNRRSLMADLDALFADGEPPRSVLALFDLNGFKTYNDTFGHPAGDALLARLGRRLDSAMAGRATAYRLGGDEFCLLASASSDERAALEAAAAAALSDHGQGFSITASSGSVLIPSEAATVSGAMRIADQRMYARKQSSRASAMRQSKDVLLQALRERHPDLGGQLDQVAELVEPLARALEMPDPEVDVLLGAAELHDVGKVAIPDAILNKPGALDEAEWGFIHRHTLVGQRIVSAAPVLAGVGELIRSSHERWDGGGYPDGLAGEDIPLGARIIAVCEAYEAMTSGRAYRRRALAPAEAAAELRRCAGTQFDPIVVAAFEVPAAQPQADGAMSLAS
jgi:diguanylate cyclase (GGDEF)-like protein